MDLGLLRLLLSRLAKPIVLAVLAYLCLRFLGFTHSQSLFASLVPLVTGVANVFASLGYLLVVVTLVAAVGSMLFPTAKQDLQRMLAGRQSQQGVLTNITQPTPVAAREGEPPPQQSATPANK